jgi:3-methylfumaryl-CoA hydratase
MTEGANSGTKLRDWIGHTETMTELVAARPVAALNATLDRGEDAPSLGDALPPLYHWLYFLPLAQTSELDTDGHPRRGGFLPPVTLPRRMWASSDVSFSGQVRIGEEATRSSVIEDVAEKRGRSGPLVFVTIRHEISNTAGIAITDRQTIVYRGEDGGGPPPTGKPAPGESDFSRAITPSAALLFRYSALIFNAHRIHYDYPFTTEVEGYPGLVVHGPLLATLLADLVRRALPSEAITRFRFRAVKPVFDNAPFTVCGRRDGEASVTLWVQDGAGELCVDAAAELG